MRVIEQRSRQPGANLYLIADANGRILTGNVESLEPGVLETEGWTAAPFAYQRLRRRQDEAARAAVSDWRRRETPTVTRRTRRSRSSRACPTR